MQIHESDRGYLESIDFFKLEEENSTVQHKIKNFKKED
jgi:hypothetical protein